MQALLFPQTSADLAEEIEMVASVFNKQILTDFLISGYVNKSVIENWEWALRDIYWGVIPAGMNGSSLGLFPGM